MRHPREPDRRHRESGVKGLTVVSNNCGVDGLGLGMLLDRRQIRKMISSYVGENKEFERQYLSGELEVEFNPQGTLAERIRAGGAGIPGFFTKTGVGTLVAEGKEHRDFDGETYVMEARLVADLAIVKAWKGDHEGNLVYPQDGPQLQPDDGDGRQGHVAEVEHWSSDGELDPDQIHTPGIFVDRIIQGQNYEKRIEQRTVRKRAPERKEARRHGLDPRRDGGSAPPRSCRTASTSISASASRRWWRTSSRRASR